MVFRCSSYICYFLLACCALLLSFFLTLPGLRSSSFFFVFLCSSSIFFVLLRSPSFFFVLLLLSSSVSSSTFFFYNLYTLSSSFPLYFSFLFVSATTVTSKTNWNKLFSFSSSSFCFSPHQSPVQREQKHFCFYSFILCHSAAVARPSRLGREVFLILLLVKHYHSFPSTHPSFFVLSLFFFVCFSLLLPISFTYFHFLKLLSLFCFSLLYIQRGRTRVTQEKTSLGKTLLSR